MSINCAVILRWDSLPEQQRALGAALWRWCHKAMRSAGMYPYLDNQAFADLLAGRLPASAATTWDAGLPRVQFTVPGDPARDGEATLQSLRRAIPGAGIAEIRVDGNQGETAMRLQWKPYLEMSGDTYQEATDKATGITAVVECDDPSSLEPWVWYLTNYPIVSRQPADNEGPAGRASTKEAAMEAAAKALPTFKQGADLQKQEKELYESEQ